MFPTFRKIFNAVWQALKNAFSAGTGRRIPSNYGKNTLEGQVVRKVGFWNWFDSPLKQGRQANLLSMLGIAIDRNLPVQMMIRASLADTSSIWWTAKLHQLSQRIDEGESLPTALANVPLLLRDDHVAAIQAAAESGTLAETLKNLGETLTNQLATRSSSWLGRLAYPGFVLLFMLLVACYLVLARVPARIASIHEDFGLRLPATTTFVTEKMNFVAGNLGWIFLAGLTVCGLLMWLRWVQVLPGLRRAASRMPCVLRLMSDSVAAGRPLVATVASFSRHHPDRRVSQRFLAVRAEMEYGNSLWLALEGLRLLGHRDSQVLQSAERAGNLSWALRRTATRLENQSAYRNALLSGIVDPALILATAVIVGLFAVALFLPLIKILDFAS